MHLDTHDLGSGHDDHEHHCHHDHHDHHGHGHHGHDHDHHCHDHDHHHHHHHHGGVPEPRKGKRGILLTAFGCALPEAQACYDRFGQEVRDRYPDMDVRWAFTANRIRAKLRKRGEESLSVAEALTRMVDDGISHVAVQSLHTLPAVEYDWTVQQAEAMRHPRKGLTGVAIGEPLLRSVDDMERATEAIVHKLVPEQGEGEGVILVGHGTYHQGHALYLALEGLLMKRSANIAMGTLMDEEAPAELGRMFLDKGVKRVFLVPFMCVPGHHVQVDLFGEHDRSWLRALSALGLEVVPVHTGSLEHREFRDIWHDHLADAVAALPAN